jgi:hypothetical protein
MVADMVVKAGWDQTVVFVGCYELSRRTCYSPILVEEHMVLVMVPTNVIDSPCHETSILFWGFLLLQYLASGFG